MQSTHGTHIVSLVLNHDYFEPPEHLSLTLWCIVLINKEKKKIIKYFDLCANRCSVWLWCALNQHIRWHTNTTVYHQSLSCCWALLSNCVVYTQQFAYNHRIVQFSCWNGIQSGCQSTWDASVVHMCNIGVDAVSTRRIWNWSSSICTVIESTQMLQRFEHVSYRLILICLKVTIKKSNYTRNRLWEMSFEWTAYAINVTRGGCVQGASYG